MSEGHFMDVCISLDCTLKDIVDIFKENEYFETRPVLVVLRDIYMSIQNLG